MKRRALGKIIAFMKPMLLVIAFLGSIRKMRKKIKTKLEDIGYTTALLPTLRLGQVVYGRHGLHVFSHYVHSAVPPRDFSSDYQ